MDRTALSLLDLCRQALSKVIIGSVCEEMYLESLMDEVKAKLEAAKD